MPGSGTSKRHLTLAEINIRDPFVIPDPVEGCYWMTGTSPPFWDKGQTGFVVYRSDDLVHCTFGLQKSISTRASGISLRPLGSVSSKR